LYEDTSRFVRQVHQETQGRGAIKLALSTLQREIGSSPLAVAPTLQTLAKRPAWKAHQEQLLRLREQAAAVTGWAKADALQKLIKAAGRDKLIIFTHFRATLDALADRLSAWGVDFVPYHGGLNIQKKDEAIRRFEEESQVLLSTEAAGEGRNLQFCHVMINFDLPWNPQRIEQRVGRIHRVGQTERVDIFNLSAIGTIEDYLLNILDRKLNMFELVIGEMEMILGHITREQNFEEMLLEVWLSSQDDAALESGMGVLGERLAEARDALHKTQAYDEAMFGEDFTA
jgi:SNF2 family DNA or RNA helicase